MLTVTGVYLMFFYVPSATLAYTNILEIQSQVTFGLLTRNIHRWAAHLMVFFVFLHMMRVFYHGAYKPPREFNWVVGVVLLFLTIMLSFSGYLLPWDQIAYWAITIGTNFGSYFPIVATPGQPPPARRRRGRPEHAAALLRAPHHGPAAARRRSSWPSTSGGSARTAGSPGRSEGAMASALGSRDQRIVILSAGTMAARSRPLRDSAIVGSHAYVPIVMTRAT